MWQLVVAGLPSVPTVVMLGNLYMPSYGAGCDLVQLRPAVVALELRMVRQGRLVGCRATACCPSASRRTGCGVLARAVHVRDVTRIGAGAGHQRVAIGIAAEALRPVVPARRSWWCRPASGRSLPIGIDGLLVEVDRDARHAGLPAQLQRQRRVVERPRRGVDHVAGMPPFSPALKGRTPNSNEGVLARAVPASPGSCPRAAAGRSIPVEATGAGVTGRTVGACRNTSHPARAAPPATPHARCVLARFAGDRRSTRHPIVACRAVHRAAGVVHRVHAGRLVARGGRSRPPASS